VPKSSIDSDTHRPHLRHLGHGLLQVAHDDAFRHFQLQPFRRQAAVASACCTRSTSRASSNWRGDTLTDTQRRQARILPCAILLAGGAQHPLAQRDDHAASSASGMKRSGPMVPCSG
jgi:hypothetical protein